MDYKSPNYLEWAKNQYGFSALKVSFFAQNPPIELWEKYAYISVWSEQLLPVLEWEGCLYIACLEPPTENVLKGFEAIGRYQLVLAPWECLQKVWKFYQSKLQSYKPSIPNIPDIATAPTPSLDIPNLSFDNLKLDASEATKPDIPKAPSLPKTPSNEKAAPSLNLDFSNLRAPTAEKPSVSPPPPPTAPAAPSFLNLQPTNEPTPPPPFYQEEALTRTGIAIPTSSAPSSQSGLEVFLESYDKAYLFLLEGQVLVPKEGIGSWTIDSHRNPKIELLSNSIFRIPYRTEQPYHGYVVSNTTNDAFFSAFHGGRIPEFCSVYPLVKNGTFIGEIICITTKTRGEQVHVSKFQKYCDDIAANLTISFTAAA